MATYQTNNGPQHFVNNYFGAAPSSDQRPETEFDLPFDVVQPLFRPQFVGRESEVSRIHEALQVAGRVQVIIHGLGGVGKTRLALEYAMRYYKAYSAVLWIDARDSSALQSSYTEIMRKLRQHYRGTGTEWSDNDSPSIVKEWLGRSANDKWILICDNLDEIKTAVRNDGLELERIFPGGLHGKIIITTRSTSLQGDCDINLGKLAQIKESLELLMHTSRRGDGVLIDPEAKLLAEDLDGLPLALCTAGKYLTQEVTTFGEYRQHHRESWRRLDSITGELLTSAETTVGSVCDIALEKLSRRNPMASKVLAFWGYFDNGDIWYELLKPTTSTSLSWLTATMRDTLSFNQTMRQLCDSGLVDTAVVLSGSSTSKGYKIHSCMHAWVKAVLLPTLETDALSTALQLMATQILPETAQNFWLHDRRILPHVRHVWPMMEQQSVSCNPMILVRMGELHQRNRNLETASALYEQAIKNFMATSTGDDKKALDAFRSLVTILIEQEQPARAVGLLDDLRSRLVDAFGERDRSTLHVLQALGWAYAESGNNDLAEAVLDYIVNIYGVEYGRMHLYTLGARNNLANLYQLKGDFAVAEQTFTEILGAMQATAGPEHPQTIGVLHNLGRLYRMQGFFANAETIYRRERDEYLRIYGKHSFKTIVATGCIGLVFRQQGRYQEAHEILQGALSTAQETQGIDNKAFNFILRLIGDVYRDQAKPEHASRYYRQAAKYANAAVSEGHPTMGATDQIYCDDEIEVYLSTVDEPSLETAAVDYHFSGPTMQVADCVSTPESEEVVDQIRARPKGDMSYRPLPPSPDPIKPLASTCSQPIAASVDLPRGQDANALSRITSLHNVFESDLIHVDDKDKEQVVAGCKDGTSIKSNFVESISNQAHWSQIGLQLGDYVHQGPFTFGPVHSPEDPKHADAIDARAPVQQEY
ncbi:Hypothetical protein D9617_13g100820 [Elsinoe fawcettii]|nr:Hypothetical protein D9617_13g100820 [Elsinoe fawcettii]